MDSALHGFYLTAIISLWAVWFFALCRERGWFCGVWTDLKNMDPVGRAVMVVLCAYCTVIAQKPSNANSGGNGAGGQNNPAPETSVPMDEESELQPTEDASVTRRQQPPGEPSQPQTLVQSPEAPAEPSRVVFQSTPASDARTEAAFGGETGWGSPAAVPVMPEFEALSFDGGGTNVPSPVCFPGATNVTVQTLMLAARGASADLATLVDAPDAARLRIAPEGAQEPEMTGAERSLTEQFQPDRWLTVGIDLETPTNLPALFFGGSAGRPEWARNWRGAIAEIVGFSTPPSADVRAGVANYLSIRWGFGGHPATPEQRQAAIDAGLHYGRTWGSVIFIR